MTDEKWRKAWEVFREIRGLPGEDREDRISAPALDPDVQAEVRALLEASFSCNWEGEIGPAGGLDARAYSAGDKLGRYVIVGRIGRGGSGEVYSARDTELGRTIALKFLARSRGEHAEQLLHEARAASASNHPNILTVYEVFRTDDRVAIAMELVDGEALRRHCGQPISLDQVITIGQQIAQALEAAHRVGVVHGDLKPENVMIRPDGFVKVLDFGLARMMDSRESGPTVPAGTLGYMSPEQLHGHPPTSRTDVFSLGVILYELATGRNPFRDGPANTTVKAIQERNPEPASHRNRFVSRQLDDLLLSMLARNPGRRPSTDQVLRGLSECRLPGGGATESRVPRGHRGRWMMAAALAATIASVVTWLITGYPRATEPAYKIGQVTFDEGLSFQPALSPDGKMIAYSSDRAGNGDLNIWLQQLDAPSQPRRLTFEEGDETAPVFSPDGASIAYSSTNAGGSIYLIPVLGGQKRLIAPRGSNLSFSQDGKKIAYAVSEEIWLADLTGGAPHRQAPGFRFANHPLWFPDGRRLLFRGIRERNFDEGWDWWVIDGDRITKAGMREYGALVGFDATPVGWLNNGSTVVFAVVDHAMTPAIYRAPFSQREGRIIGKPFPITAGIGESQPSVSPSGRLAFASLSNEGRIWTVPIKSGPGSAGKLKRLTTGGGTHLQASVSKDGTKLAYTSWTGRESKIWIRDMSRGNAMPLGAAGADERDPQVSPDGSRIAFTMWPPDGPGGVYTTTFAPGGVPRWCQACGSGPACGGGPTCGSGPPFGWSHDASRLLFLRTSSAVDVLDVASGNTSGVLAKQERDLWQVFFSPDDKWIAFLREWREQTRIWVAPIHPGKSTTQTEWIPITDGQDVVDKPRWSISGKRIYYLSRRDGYYCLWAQALNAAMKPEGDPTVVYHFHQPRLSPSNVSKDMNDISVTGDSVVLTLGEIRANVWLMDPVTFH